MQNDWLINYPVWDLDVFGGGFLIATIAVIHVFVSHFAVGGGLFLVLTEMKGYRENCNETIEYVKKHSRFFLLLTMVFGGLTGVGIWFTIGLLSPSGTHTLIRSYVFGWATEWVFFTGEIVALLIYYYTFGRMERRKHLTVGWLYFIFAWLSLFVINGIIGLMLTPGKWLETGRFFDGFFNPTFFPALAFRSMMAFMLAGLFGFITAVFIKKEAFRTKMLRYCAKWLVVPLALLLASAAWYVAALPDPQKAMVLARSPEMSLPIRAFLWISPLLFAGGVFISLRLGRVFQRACAFGLLILALLYMGSFEMIREAGRKPYVIYGHTYANSLKVGDLEKAREKGVLRSARWVKNRNITDENRLEAGGELFRLLCVSCHSAGGPMNDIAKQVEGSTLYAIEARLEGMGKVGGYMPPFPGTLEERNALAGYLHREFGGIEDPALPEDGVETAPLAVPAFDGKNASHVLLAWSESGMRFSADAGKYFSLSEGGNRIRAQLILRGELPETVSDEVEITYTVGPVPSAGGKASEGTAPFGKLSGDNTATGENTSNKENSAGGQRAVSREGAAKDAAVKSGTAVLRGTLRLDEELGIFTTDAIPLSPYTENGGFNPYPQLTIMAREAKTGRVLATTAVTAPVSTEMNCRKCHGGGWRLQGKAGVSDATALNILETHDRLNRTGLLKSVEKGTPVNCAQCHAEKGGTGGGSMGLSASIHGFHANYLTGQGAEACAGCHPMAPENATAGFRGLHSTLGLDCTSCHGELEDHALSLLQEEKGRGKRSAERLMRNLKPVAVATVEEILPRKPWVNQPDCMNCHPDFAAPETDEAEFNRWTEEASELYRMRQDDAGIMCAACHGAPHALYPSENRYEVEMDNTGPLQYQGNPYPIGANKNCRLCHTVDMEEEMHHPNMRAMFRNIR